MNVFDLMASLSLDDSGYNQSLEGAKTKGNTVASKIGTGVKNGLKVATRAVTVAGTALGGLSVGATKIGSNFESSMSQVAATMGLSSEDIQNGSEDFEALSKAAKDAGSTTAFSASEASEALNYLALAGYDAKTSAEALPSVLNLAAAGGLDLGNAADLATDAMAALGIEASGENITGFGDKLAKASSKSNTSVEQLGEAILTVGGTAKSMAGGTAELSASLGVLANRGIKGAEGGTALRNVILGLSSPTDKAKSRLDALGISVYDADGNMRPLNDTFGDLNNALAGMTEGEKTQALSEIFAKVDLKSANALLAGTGEEFSNLQNEIENSGGAMQDMADVQLDNLQGDITILKSGAEGLAVSFFEATGDDVRSGIQGLTEAIKNVDMEELVSNAKSFLSTMIKLLPIITGVVAAFEAYHLAMKAMAIIDIVKKATEGQTIAQAALNAVMSANPIGIVITLIAALVTAFITLMVTNEDFRNKVLEIWETIKSGIGGAVKTIKTFFTETIPNAAGEMITWFEGLPEKLKEIGRNIITGLWDGLKEKWTAVQDWFSDKIGGLVDKAKGILGIASPSKVFAEIGGYTAEGLGEGFEKSFTDVDKKIKGSLDYSDMSVKMPKETGVLQQSMQTMSKNVQDVKREINIALQLDGRTLSHIQVPLNNREENLVGASFVD